MGFALFLVVLVLFPLIVSQFRSAGKGNAFQQLGDIRGMPIKDIVAKVGRPTSISSTGNPNGGQLYQWMKNKGRHGYHYAIISDGQGNAVGYTHQFVQ